MKVAVLFGSHRSSGTNEIIEKAILSVNTPHEYDFIRMADNRIEGCTSCYCCAKAGNSFSAECPSISSLVIPVSLQT